MWESAVCLDEYPVGVVMVETGDLCLVAPLCSPNCGGERVGGGSMGCDADRVM